jgi:hypothetical protein
LGRGRKEINAEEEEKGLREKEEIKYPTQRKSNIRNYIILKIILYSIWCATVNSYKAIHCNS